MKSNKLSLPATVHATLVVGIFLTFLAGVALLTVEPDEVWNLMSTMKAFGLPVPPTTAVDAPVTTTGGLHALLHGAVASVRSGDVLLHRLVSVVTTLGLLALVFVTLRRHVGQVALAAAGTALFVTAPGFLLQASLATSEIIATTAFLLAALFWTGPGHRSVLGAAAAGVLFGLACATRMTCLSMLPALPLWALFAGRGWRERLVHPLLAVAIAGGVFAACVAGYVVAFSDAPWRDALNAAGASSGVTRAYEGVLLRLSYVVVGEGIVPMLAILVLVGWACSRLVAGREVDLTLRLCSFLLLAGVAGWLAWLVKAPIPHIRYLWPAIPLLWLAGILLATSAFAGVTRQRVLWIAHAVVVVSCVAQGLLNVRMLAVGDALMLVYESARGMGVSRPGPYGAQRADQQAMARYLAELPKSAKVTAFNAASAYPLTYLDGRVVGRWQPAQRTSQDDYHLMQPSDVIWAHDWDRIGWLNTHMTRVTTFGGYALYRGRGTETPEAPRVD
ncbi:ArnT family glycosyltransferase [Roseateles sp. LKC17W]|uniref:ArnT family glycosyltransferase n=1 Tax=Pelomonas margarita TaxID=3299031 RepID=A0ABW7FD28_9BURK